LLLAETFAGRITAFDIQPDGTLAGRRVFAGLDRIYPDGIVWMRKAACGWRAPALLRSSAWWMADL